MMQAVPGTGTAGLFHAGRDWFAASQPGITRADVAGLKSLRGVLRRIGDRLGFPAWYGANLDALADCLCDSGLASATVPLIAVSGLSALRATDPDGFTNLLEVLHAAAAERTGAGRPLTVVIDVAAPGVPPYPGP
ncbi:MAG: barstar family protein [Betaproteobacteria bacterium]|nr:barstar family protein [Betaproteobacteria bacterium]